MESHEEKIQEIIERNKELEAAEERKRRAKQLELQRKELAKRDTSGLNNGGFGNSFGSSNRSSFSGSGISTTTKPSEVIYDYDDTAAANRANPSSTVPFRGKGLQLGKKKNNLDGLRGAFGEEASSPLLEEQRHSSPVPSQQHGSATRSSVGASQNDGIHISIVEDLVAELGRDGSVKSSEIKGNLQLRIADPALTKIKILVKAEGEPYGVQYKTHPNVDKASFLKNQVIRLKDPSRPFPSNNQQLGVLRWKISAKSDDESLVPLTFNCWFAKSDPGFLDVTLEYELNPNQTETLHNVGITIPLVSSNAHVVGSALTWDQFDDHLEWIIPEIQPNTDSASGSFEFSAEADYEDDFFPMTIKYEIKDALTNYGRVDIADVVSASDESISLPFKKENILNPENYSIV